MKLSALFLFLILVTLPAAAAKHKDTDYQDGVLVSFHSVSAGESCSTSGNTTPTSNGAATTASTNCSDNSVMIYTVQVGPVTFDLQRTFSGGQTAGAIATAGFSGFFIKQSVLANQLPGTLIKVRSDSSGVYIRLGKRESRYAIVSAH